LNQHQKILRIHWRIFSDIGELVKTFKQFIRENMQAGRTTAKYEDSFKIFNTKLEKIKITLFKNIKLPEEDLFFADSSWNGKSQYAVKLSQKNFDVIKNKFELNDGKITVAGITIKFLSSGKTKNANSGGRSLANAGEKATIKAIQLYAAGKTVELPEDTGEELFINDVDSFLRWKNTFDLTPKILQKIIKSQLSDYTIEHDASGGEFSKQVVDKIVKLRGGSKDSWNPADIWIIKKNKMPYMFVEFNKIFSMNLDSDIKVSLCNTLIIDLYNNGILYPVSLKQITSKSGSFELANLSELASPPKNYNYEMKAFPCNFDYADGVFKTREIGVFTALNKDTGKNLLFQVRNFPPGFDVVQTEITSSGEPTGGRIGKVPTAVIDKIMSEYSYSRIKKKKEFNGFEWDSAEIKKYSNMVQTVGGNKKYFDDNIAEWLHLAQTDSQIKADLSCKIQGLIFSNFFAANVNHISDIMNKFLLGAKKISNDSGFFIKIY